MIWLTRWIWPTFVLCLMVVNGRGYSQTDSKFGETAEHLEKIHDAEVSCLIALDRVSFKWSFDKQLPRIKRNQSTPGNEEKTLDLVISISDYMMEKSNSWMRDLMQKELKDKPKYHPLMPWAVVFYKDWLQQFAEDMDRNTLEPIKLPEFGFRAYVRGNLVKKEGGGPFRLEVKRLLIHPATGRSFIENHQKKLGYPCLVIEDGKHFESDIVLARVYGSSEIVDEYEEFSKSRAHNFRATEAVEFLEGSDSSKRLELSYFSELLHGDSVNMRKASGQRYRFITEFIKEFKKAQPSQKTMERELVPLVEGINRTRRAKSYAIAFATGAGPRVSKSIQRILKGTAIPYVEFVRLREEMRFLSKLPLRVADYFCEVYMGRQVYLAIDHEGIHIIDGGNAARIIYMMHMSLGIEILDLDMTITYMTLPIDKEIRHFMDYQVEIPMPEIPQSPAHDWYLKAVVTFTDKETYNYPFCSDTVKAACESDMKALQALKDGVIRLPAANQIGWQTALGKAHYEKGFVAVISKRSDFLEFLATKDALIKEWKEKKEKATKEKYGPKRKIIVKILEDLKDRCSSVLPVVRDAEAIVKEQETGVRPSEEISQRRGVILIPSIEFFLPPKNSE